MQQILKVPAGVENTSVTSMPSRHPCHCVFNILNTKNPGHEMPNVTILWQGNTHLDEE